MVDMFIVGHLSSEFFIGAISIAVMIFNFMYWSFSFLRMGTSGFTAQAFGAKDQQEIVDILLRSLTVAIGAGLLIVLLQNVILGVAFYFIDTNIQIKHYAETYFHIYVWAAPAILGMYALMGWFIGMQDAKTPMYVAIMVNVINISLSLFFVFVLKMEIEGVAFASTIAQISGFIICLLVWNIKYSKLKSLLHLGFIRRVQDFIPFFKVNSDIFLRTLCLIAVTTFFTSASAKMGDTLLAVNSLLMQLFILFSYMMDGFAHAAEALTGRFVGERNPKMMKLLVKKLFVWGGGLTLFFTILYALYSDTIIGFLTDKSAIIAAANDYLGWVLLVPLAGFAAFLWDGIFVGMTASRYMRNSMLIAMLSFFAVYFLLRASMGNNALWLAFITYLAMRGVIQSLMYRKIKSRVGLFS